MSSEMQSMTEITKEDLQQAFDNFRKQQDADEERLAQNKQKWRDEYKFSWWERNISKKNQLTANQLFNDKTSWCESWELIRKSKDFGFWSEDFNYTLGNYGKKWRDIAHTLLYSGKDSHLVSDGVLGWVMTWKNHKFEEQK